MSKTGFGPVAIFAPTNMKMTVAAIPNNPITPNIKLRIAKTVTPVGR
jgi:hypothetical protein